MACENEMVVTIEVRSFQELLERIGSMKSSDRGLRIELPVDIKVSEYKRIAEFADRHGYQIADETEKLKVMMRKRKDQIIRIDRTVDLLEDDARRLDRLTGRKN